MSTPPMRSAAAMVLLVAAAGGLGSALLAPDPRSIGTAAGTAAVAGAAAAAVLRLAVRPDRQIRWLAAGAGLAGVGGPALVYLAFRGQPDGGGLAAAVLMLLTGFAGAALGLAALVRAATARMNDAARDRVMFIVAAACLALTGLRVAGGWWTSPDRWVRVAPAAAVPAPPVPAPPPARPPSRPPAPESACTAAPPPLLMAIEAGDAGRVRALLSAGANPNACRDLGEGSSVYALEEALRRRSVGIARLLLDAGADPNLYPQNGTPPLEQAFDLHDEDLVARLIAAGADVNLKVGTHGVPLILTAVHPRRVGIVRRMLAAGADPNVAFYGKSPLTEAVATGSTPLIEALVDGGARLGPEAGSEPDPLVAAARAGRLDVVRLLVRAGSPSLTPALLASLEADRRETALHLARSGAEVAHHYLGCDAIVEAARRDAADVLRALFANNLKIRLGCLRNALDEARALHEDTAASVLLLEELLD